MSNVLQLRPSPPNHTEIITQTDDAAANGGEAAAQTTLLVLSRNADLIDAVRRATPRATVVTHSPDLDHVADQLLSLQPGVLLIDSASTTDAAAMLSQLTQHFPELVVIVAGQRDDSTELMHLTASGRIFRFLLTPLSHGQTRLALEAAIAQHSDIRTTNARLGSIHGGGSGSKSYTRTYAALAAGLLAVIGGIWFGVRQFTSGPALPGGAAQSSSVVPGHDLPTKTEATFAELALAQQAFDQGRLLEPGGDSALDLYRNVLAMAPDNAAARAGLRAVVDKILERAEAALTAERIDEAVRTIETARDIDATHPRLAFLDTQIARERERRKLSQARDTDARVRTLIAEVDERIRNGRLITPASGNARDALAEARRLDPTEPAVVQSNRELNAALIEEARQLIAAGKTEQSQSYLNAARQLGSAGATLAAVERMQAEAARTPEPATVAAVAPERPAARPGVASRPDIDAMVVEVQRRINAGNLIAPTGATAKDALSALRAAAPDRPEADELSRTLSAKLLDATQQAISAQAYERAAQLLDTTRDIGTSNNEAAITTLTQKLAAARAPQTPDEILPASSLPRTREVAAVYPPKALLALIEGWVDIEFTIATTGVPEDLVVRDARPRHTFDSAAMTSLKKWRFEPIIRNGAPTARRARLRVRFTLQ